MVSNSLVILGNGKGKSKGKIRHIIGHEDPEG